MCKELTAFCVLCLGITADIVWFQVTRSFGFIFLLQTALGLFLAIFIILTGRKYLTRLLSSRRKLSLALI